jgi:hypothetical protein
VRKAGCDASGFPGRTLPARCPGQEPPELGGAGGRRGRQCVADVLHLIPDADDPAGIVARLVAALPAGSWLAIAHPASDVAPDMVAVMTDRYNPRVTTAATLRTHAEISAFFSGTDPLPPGVVRYHQWHPGEPARDAEGEVAAYCGLGRKSPGAMPGHPRVEIAVGRSRSRSSSRTDRGSTDPAGCRGPLVEVRQVNQHRGLRGLERLVMWTWIVVGGSSASASRAGRLTSRESTRGKWNGPRPVAASQSPTLSTPRSDM